MDVIRIGLVGFGSMGRTHAFAAQNLPYYYQGLPFRAELAGVTARRAETMAEATAVTGAPAMSFAEMLRDPRIDVIDICTPNVTHAALLRDAIAAGKHVYCEKPLCVTEAEADEVAALAAARGVTAQIVFNNRFLAPVMKMKELIDAGRLGRLYSFRACYRHASCVDPDAAPGWKQNRDICGGGVLFDLGSHVLDLLTYLCGPFLEENGVPCLTGAGQIGCVQHRAPDGTPWQTNADEAFYAIGKLACGAVGTIEANKLATGENDGLQLELYGDRGAVRFDLMDCNYLQFYDRTAPQKNDDLGGARGFCKLECVGRYPAPGGIFPGRKAPSGWLRGHIGSMYAFLSAVHDGTPASPSFTDGAYIQHLMAHLYRCDEKGIFC